MSHPSHETEAVPEVSDRGHDTPKACRELFEGFLDNLEVLAEAGETHVPGIRTGFDKLDGLMGGMREGDLIVLAGPPFVGKTALALSIAHSIAMDEGLPVLYFSLASSTEQIHQRLVSASLRIDLQRLRKGKLNDSEWIALANGIERLSDVSIFIDDHPELWIAALRQRAQRQAEETGRLGLIVVDYVQLVRGDRSVRDTRAIEIGEVVRGLKALARTLQCPILALSQINRGVETRVDKRPTLGDLRDSGAIAEDADVVLFLYRDDYYNKNSRQPGIAEILVAGQRDGPEGCIQLFFSAAQGRFDDAS